MYEHDIIVSNFQKKNWDFFVGSKLRLEQNGWHFGYKIFENVICDEKFFDFKFIKV